MCWSAGRGGISWSLSFQRLSVSTQVSQFFVVAISPGNIVVWDIHPADGWNTFVIFCGYLLSCVYFCWIRAVGYFFTAHSHNISPSWLVYIYTNQSQLQNHVSSAIMCLVIFCFGRYIDYNVKKLAKPGSIARHTDNDSMVTMVVSWRPWKNLQPWEWGGDIVFSTYWQEVMRCQR